MKNSTIIAILIVVGALGIWYFVSRKDSTILTIPFISEPLETADTLEAINAGVESIDVGSIDRDIQSLEADIQRL